LTGVVKGLVEFLMGGTHGVVIILVSGVEGAFADLGMSLDPRRPLWVFLVAGAVASSSNVFVFQALYFAGIPWTYILFMAGLAAGSGAILGGWLAHDLLLALKRAGLARISQVKVQGTRLRGWLAAGVALAILVGGGFYYLRIYQPPLAPRALRVLGAVEHPFTFVYEDWEGKEVTISATLEGAVTYVPGRLYTGVPVGEILARARPLPEAELLIARGKDGYTAEFSLAQAIQDPILVVREGDSLRLVAKGHPGALWVRDLVALEVK